MIHYDDAVITVLHQFSTSPSEKGVEMLPGMPQDSKMIFHGDYLLVWKVILQGAELSKHTREMLCYLLDDYKDIMSSSSNDIGCMKLIKWV